MPPPLTVFASDTLRVTVGLPLDSQLYQVQEASVCCQFPRPCPDITSERWLLILTKAKHKGNLLEGERDLYAKPHLEWSILLLRTGGIHSINVPFGNGNFVLETQFRYLKF